MKKTTDFDIPKNLQFSPEIIREMGGLKCEAKLNPSDFAGEMEPTNKLLSARIKLDFLVGSGEIFTIGKISAEMELVCYRCLKEYRAKKTWEFEDETPLNAPIIDIMGKVRETLVIANEIRQVCSEKCKGLCPICGKNLNEGTCNCDRTPPNAFSVLKTKYKKEQ